MAITKVEQKIAEIRVMLKKIGIFYTCPPDIFGDKSSPFGVEVSHDAFVKEELEGRVKEVRMKLAKLEDLITEKYTNKTYHIS